jgi:hypothetical protein
MAKKDDPAVLKTIREALAAEASRRAPLVQWMWDNHDAFAAELRNRRPDWERLTAVFRAQGFANADGSPLRAATVSRSWRRVRVARAKKLGLPSPAAADAGRVSPATAAVPTSLPPAARSRTPPAGPATPISAADAGPPPPRPTAVVIEPIRPVTLKPSPPSDPPAAATRPAIPRRPDPPPPTPEEVQERLRQLDEKLKARSNRMPEPIYDVGDPRGKKSAGK